MDDERLFESLKVCCRGISEVLRNMRGCPHPFRQASNSEQARLCADCLSITSELSLITIQLEGALMVDWAQDVKDQANYLFRILRGVCFWPPSELLALQNKLWDLATVTELFDETHKEALGRSISQYLDGPLTVREKLLDRCKKLSQALQSEEKERITNMKKPRDHSCSHKALFSALCKHTSCNSCHLATSSETESSWHPTRLVLVDRIVDTDDIAHFDVIASSDTGASSAQNGWWQDICIKVPLIANDNGSATLPSPANLKDFCGFFEREDGCRISLQLQDGALFRTDDDALKHRASPGTGMSLAHVLDEFELSVKQKLSLAHSVALAFWQYYDSQLMHRAWTSQTIWFMPEPDLEDDSERLPLRTYITFHPEATKCAFDASEFIKTYPLIHRCPRIQYLALLLLEIGLGKSFRGRSFSRQVLQLNYYNSIALKYLEELKLATWESFDHKYILTDAIEECLEFNALTGKDGNLDTSDCRIYRRSKIYDKVVSPLGWLNSSFQRATAQIDYLTVKRHSLVPELAESRFTNTAQCALPTDSEAKNGKTMEASGMRPINREGFETAIICALTLEADAVEALFDHHWSDDEVRYGKVPGDPNGYSTGIIGRHNVVLVHMSSMGKSAAAGAAIACRMSFPKIKIALLVGVCGVVPVIHSTGKPINLGDVIISNGVIQYDFGRQYPDRYERKDTLLDSVGRASLEIRSTLNKVQSLRGRKGLQSKMTGYLERLGQESSLCAKYPTTGNGKLPGRSEHYAEKVASQRGRDRAELGSRHRPGQNSVNAPEPAIHFGLIASGDTVMKSEKRRDDIARREKIIAFEMEGAAVWDAFPTLVIKGACDYADSQKTKEFQRYAAATAAACTRAFLDSWESS